MVIPTYMTLVKGRLIDDTFGVCKVNIEVTPSAIKVEGTTKYGGTTKRSFVKLSTFKEWYDSLKLSKHGDINKWRIRERHTLKHYYQDEQGKFIQI